MFSPEFSVKLVERLGPPRVRKSLLNGAKGLVLRLVGRVLVLPEVELFVKRKFLLAAAQTGVEEIPECPRVEPPPCPGTLIACSAKSASVASLSTSMRPATSASGAPRTACRGIKHETLMRVV